MMRSFRPALLLSMIVASGSLGVACFSSSGGSGSTDAGMSDVAFDGFATDSTLPEDAAADAPIEAGIDSPVEAAGDGTVTMHDAGMDSAAVDAAPDAPGIVSFYVDPATGSDTNDGSMGAPFQSITHASQAMNTVDAGGGPFNLYLADGTYSATNQPANGLQVSFTHTTFVHGSAPGNVIILGQGPLGGQEGLTFSQGGGVQNVLFRNTWYGVEAIHGTFSVAGCSFDGAGQGGYFAAFINDTVGTFDTTGVNLTNFTQSALGGVYVDNTARVSWIGGGVPLTGGGAGYNIVFMRGGAQLTVDNVSVTTFLGYFLVGYDQSQVTVTNSTFTGSGWASGTGGLGTGGLFYLGQVQTGAPAISLTLTNTTFTSTQGSVVAYELLSNTASFTFNATSSHLDNSTQAAIWVQGQVNTTVPIAITATGTTFNGNGLPAIYAPHATVSLTGAGSSVSNNGAGAAGFGQTPGGIVLSDATAASSLTMRSTTVASNSGNLILFKGTAASTLDLGTSASAGANAFSGVTVGALPLAAVNTSALIAATAIGNTWIPNVQGANASGQYTTPTTIVGAASGQNVIQLAGASIVMAP